MSLYAQYLKERSNDSIIETEYGFATYRVINVPNQPKGVYIIDIYTHPDFRKSGKAAALADLVVEEGKKQGCTEVIGTVVPSTKGSSASLKVLLAYGMELSSSGQDYIVFKKQIER